MRYIIVVVVTILFLMFLSGYGLGYLMARSKYKLSKQGKANLEHTKIL